MIPRSIENALKKASGEATVELEFPENENFGDFSSNVALRAKNPKKAAEEILRKLKADEGLGKIVDKIEIAGPGFINFWLKKDVLVDELQKIQKEGERYGESDIGGGKTVIIDYSSPNIAKPFGIGHLRSTIIGAALVNLYKTLGYKVIGDNHLGDWGTQFGKLIYMIKKKNVKDFDVVDLEELYTEFHRLAENPAKADEMEAEARGWFKKLEEGDSEAKSIWQKCVDVSMREFNRIYEMLGVKIDFAYGESAYQAEMESLKKEKAVRDRLTKGADNAWIINLDEFGIKTPLMFLKSDGATTYATRDLATIRFRVRKWNPDIFIYEVGAEQTLHFEQVFAAARFLGLVSPKVELVHTAHGLYLASDGKKFSTRRGKTVKLEEVLDEAIARAKKLGNSSGEIAKEVGIGAVKYYDLMHAVTSNVVFDWEKMMNLEGNSGPYLQYTVARCNSVLKKATLKGLSLQGEAGDLKGEELSVLRMLSRFLETIEIVAKTYSPNLLCNYLYGLAQKYNNFYNADRIIGSDNEKFRLTLTFGTAQILKNGLKILGIQTPEKM